MNEQKVEINLKKKFLQAVSSGKLQSTFDKIAVKIVDLMRKRTNLGLDINGRKFGGYNRSYDKIKAMKYAGKKFGTTDFQGSTSSGAGRTPLRLTGRLFSAMDCKLVSVRQTATAVTGVFKVYINDPSQQKKVEGLLSTTGTARNMKTYSKKDWQFLGLSVTGSYRETERAEINSIIRRDLNLLINTIKVS